mgnify:CR=1 FL=1
MGRSILFLILLFVFPLSACSHKSSAPVSADTMPDMEELLAYSQSHSQGEYEKKLKEIQAVIDNTSYEELCQIFTDSLASWADTQTDYEITDTSMKFSEDPLLMDEQRKEKLYNNWTVSVNIQLAGDEKSKYDLPDAAAIYRQAADALRSTPYGAYKLHTLKITASSDPDWILTSEQEGSFFLTDSAFSLPQEPEELAIQKAVLEQVEAFNQEFFSDERYRGQGIGRQLVYEGLDSLNEFGYAAVVTLGDPDLYRRFGFESAARFDLRCRWPDSAEAFQVHRLADDALDGVHGQVEYSEHFNRL